MDSLFTAGAWRAAYDSGTRTIHCPADGQEVVTVAEATEQDARDAVAAARAAFDTGPWPRTPAPERAAPSPPLPGPPDGVPQAASPQAKAARAA